MNTSSTASSTTSSQNKFPNTHRDRGPSVSRFAAGPPASSNPSDVLSGNHPLLDRYAPIKANSYHQKMAQQNSEVMKRPLR
jgi:hypothetical protein